MFFRQFVGRGYGHFLRGIIFDRRYKNLDDLISRTKRWYHQFGDGARFLASGKDVKWVWPTGEELLFRVMASEDDYWDYHGQEFPFIGWNELTKHPTGDLYDTAMSLNRTSFIPEVHSPDRNNPLPPIPLVVLSTTNPYGPGHNWVKTRFIDAAPPGQVVKMTREVFNPQTQRRELITKTQVRIFCSYKENKFLPPEYILELESITDENKRKAWLWGDWDITSGGMFDDVWSSQYNQIGEFNVPAGWPIYRTFDWGSSKPFSVGWWTEADGSDIVMRDGTVRSTIRGDLIRIGEWYGWTGKPNTGKKMLNKQIAKGIIMREIRMGIHKRVKPGPADSSIFSENSDGKLGSIAKDMAKKVTIDGRVYRGVKFTRADKSPGSRKNGWELMRQAMYDAQPPEGGGPREAPGLFVTTACKDGFLRTVPTIPRSDKDLDDVDTESEDHCADESRYMVLSLGTRFRASTVTGQVG